MNAVRGRVRGGHVETDTALPEAFAREEARRATLKAMATPIEPTKRAEPSAFDRTRERVREIERRGLDQLRANAKRDKARKRATKAR